MKEKNIMSLLTVYVHGIGDHGTPDKVKVEWDGSIFGKEMGYRTRTAFWSDIRYPRMTGGETKSLAAVAPAGIWDASSSSSFLEIMLQNEKDEEKREFMTSLFMELYEKEEDGSNVSAKFIPLPKLIRNPLTKVLTSLFIKDVAAYFYDEEQRNEIRSRLIQCLSSGHENHLLVTHSMGTVIAYDVLSDYAEGDISVPLWVTIGSPLGIQEVQDRIRVLRKEETLKRPAVVKRWMNFADRLDVVAIDSTVRDDYSGEVKDPNISDKEVTNPDRLDFTQYGPHSGTGYLRIGDVKNSIIHTAREIAGENYLKELSDFVVAKDVAYSINRTPSVRIPVLIELDEKTGGENLQGKRAAVINTIRQITSNVEEAEIDEMVRYVSASLTSEEIDKLNSLATAKGTNQLTMSRIWSNGEKRALVNAAGTTVHSTVARLGYQASGRGIGWAVLDSGIEARHPHFSTYNNIVSYYDCTKPGIHKLQLTEGDENGHGTHVCGIIAGQSVQPDCQETLYGIAPETKLHVYKVLKDDGTGRDCFSIKALDHIAQLNEASNQLVIHGINLSLGGPADNSVYATGHAPLCRELRRLWRQGVVIVVAAGNEGITTVFSKNGFLSLSTSITISDPANLEECIAVGSIHKTSPHFYGPSYFSSRGPTSDGRLKPDVVAPGEKIVSCNSKFADDGSDHYIELSGTSMAAPVVSGLIAGFLSVRSEFIGRPDHVKEILFQNCTDLKRDRYSQGHGLPNLVKMILNT